MFDFLKQSAREGTNRAILLSMAMSLAAKLLNFGQSVAVSYAFGTSTSTDILFYALSMVILLTTFQGSMNQQVIVPVSIGIRAKQSEASAQAFISRVYLIYASIGIIVLLILMGAPVEIISFLSRFSRQDIENNLGIIRLILPSMLLITMNTYMLDIFTSYRYFTFPMLLDMLKNLAIIAAVLSLQGVYEEQSLAIGILIGNAVQFILLNYLLVSKLGLRLSLKKFPIGNEVRKNIGFVLAGRLSTFVNDFAMIYLLTGFTAGVYSAMDYAFRIDSVLNMVIVGQITTVIGVRILELQASGDTEELKKVFLGYLHKSLFFLTPLCFMISLGSVQIISILFQRGSFTAEDVEVTSYFLRYFVLTTPLELMNGFVVILIIAKQIQRIAFRWQIFQSLLNIAVIWAGVSVYGYKGYPVAVLLSLLIYIVIMIVFMVRKEFGFIRAGDLLKPYVSGTVLCALVMWVIYLLAGGFETVGGFAGKMVSLVLMSAGFMLVFLILSMVTGIGRTDIRELGVYLRSRLHSWRSGK